MKHVLSLLFPLLSFGRVRNSPYAPAEKFKVDPGVFDFATATGNEVLLHMLGEKTGHEQRNNEQATFRLLGAVNALRALSSDQSHVGWCLSAPLKFKNCAISRTRADIREL